MAFRIPTRTVVGPGSVLDLSRIVGHYEAGAAVVVTDEGLSATHIPRTVSGQLETAGFRPLVLTGVSPNPRVPEVDAMAGEARAFRPSLVVAVGGGSVLDAAKGVALLLTNPGSAGDYEGRNRFRRAAAPLVAIPTTCGTGSEVTWVSVLSEPASRRKISIKGDGLFPEWAVVDADLLKTLPAHLVAATGMDAITHAVEAFIGRAANPVSDALAASALALLVGNLEAAVEDVAGNAKAREAVMRASTLAGLAFGNADVGPVHCLSEAIGGRHDLPHGLLNAVLLIPVLEYLGDSAAPRLAQMGKESGVGDVPHALASLGRAVGIPEFPDLSVPEDDFRAIAESAESNGSNPSSPRRMAVDDYLRILSSF